MGSRCLTAEICVCVVVSVRRLRLSKFVYVWNSRRGRYRRKGVAVKTGGKIVGLGEDRPHTVLRDSLRVKVCCLYGVVQWAVKKVGLVHSKGWYHQSRLPVETLERCISSCKNFQVVGAKCQGRSRRTWGECVRDDIKSLGLKTEWAQDRSKWRGLIRWTVQPVLA